MIKNTCEGIILYHTCFLFYRFCFAKNCFISGLFTQVEWNIYCDWHRFLVDALPLHFDGFIYLRADPNVGLYIFVVIFIVVILWCTSFFRFAMRDFRKGNGLRYRQNFSVVELLNKDISIKNIKQNFLLKTS